MAKRIALFFGVVYVLGAQAQAADAVKSWRVIHEKSKISFSANYAGSEVTGEFPSYMTDIKFDPTHLDKSKVLVRIELAKVKSSDKDAEQSLPGADWFDTKAHPIATFETHAIEGVEYQHVPDGTPLDDLNGRTYYTADGTLTIRGKSVPLSLQFSYKIFKGDGADAGKTYARVNGTATLKRLDFGVGQGEWAGTSTVKNEVAVQIKIEAVSP